VNFNTTAYVISPHKSDNGITIWFYTKIYGIYSINLLELIPDNNWLYIQPRYVYNTDLR